MRCSDFGEATGVRQGPAEVPHTVSGSKLTTPVIKMVPDSEISGENDRVCADRRPLRCGPGNSDGSAGHGPADQRAM